MKTILDHLEASAAKYPDKILYADESDALTYRDFVRQARSVGTCLSRLGTHNAPVAVFMDKSARHLAAMMGVAYSGNFYVVLDVHMPADRVSTIFDTLAPAALLTEQAHLDEARSLPFSGPVIPYEEAAEVSPDLAVLTAIRDACIDTDPLYTLFTSGSTGVPKGTVVSHKSVVSYAKWVRDTFAITSDTVFGNQTPFYFSMSVLDIFTTMLTGATMNIIPKTYFSFPVKLFEFMQARQVNTVYWVPSVLSIVANMKTFDYLALPLLRKVLFAGEVMPTKQLNYWIAHLPGVLFANLYGPTEVTDICSYYVVDRPFADDEPLPIGRHCDNCGLIILTEDGRPARDGEIGELCVRGSFLAAGYYNNPEKTAEVFVQNPLNPHYPEIIYKTGDLVRTNGRGELIYVSRKDFQIKHMGYRIELGEIEAAAGVIDGLTACVCIFDAQKDKIVLLYEGMGLTKQDVTAGLRKKLPEYMMPGKIIRMTAIPHNGSGKIDRAFLKANYSAIEKEEDSSCRNC